METELVRKTSQQLKQTNSMIIETMNELKSQVQFMMWEGQSAEEFRAEFDSLNRQILSVCEQGNTIGQRVELEVQEWLAVDGQGANHLQEVSKSLSSFLLPAAGGVFFAGTPQVLGVSTISSDGQYIAEYQQMPWNKKLQTEKDLTVQIAEQKKTLAEMKSADELQNDIASFDEKIAELEKKKSEAQAQADQWYNKIIPDTPLATDKDGVPWRVRTDDFEDQIADVDRQIKDLQAQKQAAQQNLVERQNLPAQLAELEARQTALSQVIDQGIAPDKPATPAWLKNHLGGCTNYVAEKRDVSAFPNDRGQSGHPGDAYQWDNQAQKAGYDVGSRPVKGSIMVFEGNNNVARVDQEAGHVAYVENVKKVDGGYEVTISQANTMYDKNGNFIRGTHTSPQTSKILIKDSARGVSFIYDKPKK
jgi:surface antigen/uncharacterized protein YukE